ncbi:MAG TPA: hypothetical protein PK088_11510, partial [Ignavibacteriales bacterium]|nr:hypothetical protein [Ignavibacteriales bacterium]
VYGYHPETKQMMLLSLHVGKTLDDIKNNTGFEMLIPEKYDITEEPTDEELRILREKVDPMRLIIGRV